MPSIVCDSVTRVAVSTLMLSAVAAASLAQSSPSRTPSQTPPLSITGRVRDAHSGEPIRNARITITPALQGAPVVLSDQNGRFTLSIPPGRYSVAASKTGYARRDVALVRTGDPIDIHLTKGAVIAGRVVDEWGDPVVGARVAAVTSERPGVESAMATTETDDRGEYRLPGLASATPLAVVVTTVGTTMATQSLGGNQFRASPTLWRTYYPGGTAEKSAQDLRLEPGEERGGLDLVVESDRAAGLGGQMIVGLPIAPRAAQTSTEQATGIVRGRIATTDGRPVPHARVLLFSAAASASPWFNPRALGGLPPSQATRSDEEGRYEFREVPGGNVTIASRKIGYSPVEPGQPVSFGVMAPPAVTVVEVAEGGTRERVDVTMARWGTVTGHVYDEAGEPLQGARVDALHVRYERGRRWLTPGADARLTDDRGRYRLFGLGPGQYIVSAVVGDISSAEVPGYARSYSPGTPAPGDAQFVSVGLSQDVESIDVSLVRARTARVAGRVVDAAGQPTTGGSLQLMPSQRSTLVTNVPVGARIQDDGRFEFPNVPPAEYVIKADRGQSNSWTEGEFGAVPVTIDGVDVTDVVLHMSKGSTVRGRITFDTVVGSQTPSPSAIELSPIAVDPDQSPRNVAKANIHADWTFELSGINGPRRLTLRRAGSGWSLKEVRVNGIDVTDQPLMFGQSDQSITDVEVVLTDRVTTLAGTVVDDRGRAVPGGAAVIFSTDRSRWYPSSRFLHKADTGNGGFKVQGLPSDDYYVVALVRVPADGEDAWQDPAFLESLIGGASIVRLSEGQEQMLTLKWNRRP